MTTCNRLLAPFGDPLLIDFGLHRWLKCQREESYSDWLQWIIERLDTDDVLALFGVSEPQARKLCKSLPFVCNREVSVPEGHEGHKGRLDLVIRFDDAVILVIEAKLQSPDAADAAKHQGYVKWLRRQNAALKIPILVVAQSNEDDSGFRARYWEQICVELRFAAVQRSRRKEFLLAPMLLAFVSAVEQNILKFPRVRIRGNETVNLQIPLMARHLENFIARTSSS